MRIPGHCDRVCTQCRTWTQHVIVVPRRQWRCLNCDRISTRRGDGPRFVVRAVGGSTIRGHRRSPWMVVDARRVAELVASGDYVGVAVVARYPRRAEAVADARARNAAEPPAEGRK